MCTRTAVNLKRVPPAFNLSYDVEVDPSWHRTDWEDDYAGPYVDPVWNAHAPDQDLVEAFEFS